LTSRIALHTRRIAEPAAPEDPNAVELVGCGQPIADHEIRIVDDMGRELGERREGGLEFRGPSATSGYFQNPAKTRDLFHAGWLDTRLHCRRQPLRHRPDQGLCAARNRG
jgi:acyl-CoA synthetase (AMP-forming)/AMP-acid ligase II